MSEINRGDEIPRRARVDLWCDAEKAIQAAVDAVEAMPADVRLTDAVNQLWEARQSVADYVDGVPRRVPAVVKERDTLARWVREEWAFNHGCPIGAIYGDDGELQCNRCGIDFKRTDLEELSQLVTFARAVAAGAKVVPAPPVRD